MPMLHENSAIRRQPLLGYIECATAINTDSNPVFIGPTPEKGKLKTGQ